jgi:hypothetical protein
VDDGLPNAAAFPIAECLECEPRFTLPNSDDAPAFSPDGRSLVFSRNSGSGISEIYFLALATDLAPKGQPKQLTFKQSPSKTRIGIGRAVATYSAEGYRCMNVGCEIRVNGRVARFLWVPEDFVSPPG